MVVIGDKIEGKKIVEILCECKHSKSNHADKEIHGKQIRKGDQLITPITFEKNRGKCTEDKCKCYEYSVGAVRLENDKILKYSEFFKCAECGKYLGLKKEAKTIYWGHRICKSCAPEYYKECIDELNENILVLKELKELLVEKYPEQIEKTAEIEVEYGYDYECSGTKSVSISILLAIDTLLAELEEEKKTWESYK